ncbi:hypothetical protein ACWGH5_40025 [Streptomyces sp. NPDC054864]
MLNPIDATAVIRDSTATGLHPGQIHPGVAWWVASCMVVVTQTPRLHAAHDGHPVSVLFHEQLCQGAVNAQHYACTVIDLGHSSTDSFHTAQTQGGAPGIYVSTEDGPQDQGVTLALYTADGKPLSEDGGLARIRDMIDHDRVPIPVNATSKGRIQRGEEAR